MLAADYDQELIGVHFGPLRYYTYCINDLAALEQDSTQISLG